MPPSSATKKDPKDLPYITQFPSSSLKQDLISSAGEALYTNLVNTWVSLLNYYSAQFMVSPSLRTFLESYLEESAKELVPKSNAGKGKTENGDDPSLITPNDYLQAFQQKLSVLTPSDTLLRSRVFTLLTSTSPTDSSSYPFLDCLSYPHLYLFLQLFGPTNLSATQTCVAALYTSRGGKPFVNALMATVLAESELKNQVTRTQVSKYDAAVVGKVVLPASPLLAKDWVGVKWFFALEGVYRENAEREEGTSVCQAVMDTAAASFLVSVSILDTNTKIRVINDIISRANSSIDSNDDRSRSSQQYHLLSALLNYTNFAGLIGVPSLTVTLETAKLRLPKVKFPGSLSSSPQSSNQSKGKRHENTEKAQKSFTPFEKREIEQVRDLFPQLSDKAVYKLLTQHGHSAETVTSYLLDNMDEIDRLAAQLDVDDEENGTVAKHSKPSLPKSSSKASLSKSTSSQPKPSSSTTPSAPSPSSSSKQRSIYDNDELATLSLSKNSSLHIGKKEFGNITTSKASKKSLENTLERIYNAVEEEGDEYDDTYDDVEMTKSLGNNKNKTVGLGNDDETPGASTPLSSSATTQGTSGPSTTQDGSIDRIEQLLWSHYERQPTEFLRSARKSRARKDLIAATSWSDEQIEGWARMLERQPKRKQMLADKFMFGGIGMADGSGGGFRGNAGILKPTAFRQKNKKKWGNEDSDNDGGEEDADENENAGDVGESDASKVGIAKNNNNRKNNSRPEISSAEKAKRDQKRKEKNKARSANHNRKAGHDKKMVKAGAFS